MTTDLLEADTYYPIDLGDGDQRFSLEVNCDGGATIVFAEAFDFHVSYLERELTEDDLIRARQTLVDEIRKIDPDFTDAVYYCDYYSDEEFCFEFYIGHAVGDGETLHGVVTDHMDFISACVNCSDPGSFGSPYMFDRD